MNIVQLTFTYNINKILIGAFIVSIVFLILYFIAGLIKKRLHEVPKGLPPVEDERFSDTPFRIFLPISKGKIEDNASDEKASVVDDCLFEQITLLGGNL